MGKTIVKHSFFKGILGGSSYLMLFVCQHFFGEYLQAETIKIYIRGGRIPRTSSSFLMVTYHPVAMDPTKVPLPQKGGGMAFQHRLKCEAARPRCNSVQICALLVQICDQCWICDRYVCCT